MCKVSGNRKCTEWPQTELEHVTVKITLYILNTYTRGTNLVRFALRLAVSEKQHVQGGQNRKCTEWPQNELKHLTVKSTLYTLHTYPCDPNFNPFCSISGCQDTRSLKIGNAPNDPNWTSKLNSQNHPVYTKYLPQRSTFWSVSLYD